MAHKTAPRQGADLNSGVYGTPIEFLRMVDSLFPFSFDLAANHENSAANRLHGNLGRFCSEESDSLIQDWAAIPVPPSRSWLWLNPPFAHIEPWAKKCAEESAKGARILLLVPQGSQGWNRNHCQGKSLELRIDGRLTFVGQTTPYPKDMTLFVFGGGMVGTGFLKYDGGKK